MPQFDIGAVFSRFFKLVGGNFPLFAVIGLIGTVLPTFAVSYVATNMLQLTQGIEAYSHLDTTAWLMLVGAGLAVFIINLMVISAITEVAILRAVDKPVSAGALLGSSLRNALPIFVVSLLAGLFIVGGMILLIIPGIFLALCLCVAVPAYVGQPHLGIWGAVMKSFELTRGNRWWILLIGVVLFFASMIVGTAVGGALIGVALSAGDVKAGINSLPYQIINSVFTGFSNLIGYIFAAALYVCLRESKEKLAPENAASVFS